MFFFSHSLRFLSCFFCFRNLEIGANSRKRNIVDAVRNRSEKVDGLVVDRAGGWNRALGKRIRIPALGVTAT